MAVIVRDPALRAFIHSDDSQHALPTVEGLGPSTSLEELDVYHPTPDDADAVAEEEGINAIVLWDFDPENEGK